MQTASKFGEEQHDYIVGGVMLSKIVEEALHRLRYFRPKSVMGS